MKKVYPLRRPDGCGCIWEYFLAKSGFNDLPKKYQYLLVTEIIGATYTIICPYTDFEYWCCMDEVSNIKILK